VLGTHLFRAQIQNAKRDGIKNLFVFDIQTDQEAPLRALFAAQQTEVAESVPIVLMRIDSINGKRSEELLKGGGVPEWTLRRDYWTTYREEMIEGEDLIAGEWVGKVDSSIEPIPISVEDELAKRLNLSLGGEVVWDVQGVRIRTVVKNLRNIHWERMRRNAFVVFPAGVLESAPQFLFFTAETKTAAETATLQRAITEAFPNISIVDLRGIVSQVEGVLTSISHAVLLLSLLVGATGFVVVLAITLSGAGARRDEGVFLRTLGATKSDLSKVLLTEHLTLALAAVLAGAAAALVVLWAIARWGMKVPFTVPLLPLTTTALAITLLVVLFTVWANRKMLTTPCLEVLRR
jgi:putative ABC transport system permease protein